MSFLTDRKSPSATSGYFILSMIFIIAYVLIMNNAIYLIFMIPLMIYFILSLFGGSKSIDRSLAEVGWGGKDLSYAIPMGFLCALICLVIGCITLEINLLNACLSPSSEIFNNNSKLFDSLTTILILNILYQLFIVAPAEETSFRSVVPYALEGISTIVPKSMRNFFESPAFTYTISTLIWTLFHYPTFKQNNADPNMYLVIILWGIIFTVFMFATGSILTCIIGHAITNISILLINENVFSTLSIILGIVLIIIISFYNYTSNGGKIKSNIKRGVRR